MFTSQGSTCQVPHGRRSPNTQDFAPHSYGRQEVRLDSQVTRPSPVATETPSRQEATPHVPKFLRVVQQDDTALNNLKLSTTIQDQPIFSTVRAGDVSNGDVVTNSMSDTLITLPLKQALQTRISTEPLKRTLRDVKSQQGPLSTLITPACDGIIPITANTSHIRQPLDDNLDWLNTVCNNFDNLTLSTTPVAPKLPQQIKDGRSYGLVLPRDQDPREYAFSNLQ
jgi:hypothetical protein